MGTIMRLKLFLSFASFLQITNGCHIEGGLNLGPMPNIASIDDTFRGIIRSEATSNIQHIQSISYGGALLSSQAYLTITHENSQFVMQTSSTFDQYEANEVVLNFSVTITFQCTGGNTSPLIFVINVADTNNNYPEFVPTNSFDFVVRAPLPPGFLLTGCLNEITVRDIDLTTSSIRFEIEDNPYFEIEYDPASCPAPVSKEFKAQLRTTTFIRSLIEPIALTIKATDVDATGDPPLSTSGTIRISGDPQFVFPEEPVFSQTFYFANYTDDHQLILLETITLTQGFDANVNFALDGGYQSYFAVNPVDNQVSLAVSTQLPDEVMVEREIYVIVRADKEYTSGATATIVISLPEETPLLFENTHYEGYIVDNNLHLSPLVLSQGYEGVTVTAEIVGDYKTSFSASVQENLVTVTMTPLTDEIIEDNSFISVRVVALTGRSEAVTIVNLNIIKDDNVTPAFDKSIYSGSYDPDNGLTVDEIVFVQGFDETVSVDLLGEHRNLFQINDIGPIIRLTSSIPPELIEEQRITLSIKASKPRTVGANAAVIITLPAARELDFEETTYRGTIQDDELKLQTIILREGYDHTVRFGHIGDFSTYFGVTNDLNEVTVTLLHPLPDSAILQNSVLMLTLTASGQNAITTSTNIILDIVMDDTATPVFSQNIYYGTYRGPSNFEIENIFLAQGYDDELVSFKLDDSAHAKYFDISNTENSVTITLQSAIPEDVIFDEKFLLFNVLADKALTVGSKAAILIRFPAELTESTIMRFSKNYYVGAIKHDELALENLILDTGYTTGTNFVLSGDYDEHFDILDTNNVVKISIKNTNPLPPEIIENNDFIILTVEARRQRAVSVWTSVVIGIVKEEIEYPVFNQAYYRGGYTEEKKLQFEENIYLSDGYDGTVRFELEGEQAIWFSVDYEGNAVTLNLKSEVPLAVLEENNQLLFTIVALKTNRISGHAVISIDLPKENYMRFSQDYYRGYIADGIPTLDDLTIEDFFIPSDVVPVLSGDYSEYFQVNNQNGNLKLELKNPIPADILKDIKLLILTLAIQYGNNRIRTVIAFEVFHAENENMMLAFEKTYYVGSYNELQGLELNEINIIDDNFDATTFEVEGEDAQWFGLERKENSVKLVLSSPIPPAVLANKQQLVFIVNAQRPGSIIARATIVISLTSEYTEGLVLGFDRISYIGSIENNQTTIAPIILSEGYVPGVEYALHGELEPYFSMTPQEATVIVTLRTPIPEQFIPANRIIVLEIQASAPQTKPAYATLVFEHVVHNDPVVELIFAQIYYTGSYTETEGLVFTTPISLAEGYDANVEFVLEGDQSLWFTLEGPGNSENLVLSSPIPQAVLANNQQLVFIVNAQRPGSTIARSTIVISLTSQYTEGLVLGFDQISYIGSIENNQTTIAPIILSEGYVPGVEYALHGELEPYFSMTPQEATVIVTLRTPIPEQLIPANRIIVLEIQASALQTKPAYATLVFEHVVHNEPVVELIFAQIYYTGSYTETEGLVFTTPISLAEGYDANVEFVLEGDQSHWFTLEGSGNSENLVLSSPIPQAVLVNNQYLVFIVNAHRPGSTIARSTIVISLTSEYTEGLVLGFDRISYIGSIENDQTTIAPIILSEGYVPGVEYALHGELEPYFSMTPQEATVIVTLRTPIPEQLIPANRIIVLEIQASAPQTKPAYATLVFEHVVHNDPVVELIFAQIYYTGSYTETEGLVFTTPISLAEGYDAKVEFVLEGDQSLWFTLEGPGNSENLVLSSPIPQAVLANNQQLVFIVNAQRPGSTIARSTIVISLTSQYTEGLVLGFDRISYIGSIENNQTTIAPIILSEGYVPGVEYALHGELEPYFSMTPQEATVIVTLRTPIPEQLIPANRIIVLEIQASAPQTKPAYATLVFEHVVHNDPVLELIFAQIYYTGSYTETEGLVFTTPISLAEGFDANVEFVLEGDQSLWFTLEGPGNSENLVLSSPIPQAVLANNQQLVFIVNAQRPGSTIARSTIVISLTSQYTEGLVLGFDRISYIGSIENNQTTIAPIILSEGYVPGVEYALHGELEPYFSMTPQEATVIVTLRTPIPEQLIPANRIIVLEIQASAPQTKPAYATLVFEHVVHNDPVVELILAQIYYTGSYTETEGLVFTTPISLAEGYDANVDFVLEGDQSLWFTLEGPGNSENLVLSSPIPQAVLANNQQLVFIVNAQRPGSTIARSTIVISLTSQYTEGLVLGFDRISYIGSIENNQTTIAPIILSEGYVPGVEYALHGELEPYFSMTPQEATVIVTLRTPIPEQLIPANRIIVLEIQASAPQTKPAYATLVFEHVVHNDPVVELILAQIYYTGSYTETEGLVFTTPISLAEGYDPSVEFVLEGDLSHWFTLEGPGNSERLVLSSPIPPAVLADNQQLVFIVNAQRPGSTIAKATIVISLTSGTQTGSNETFDKFVYEGVIHNGVVDHERITITGFSGTRIDLYGEYKSFFESELSNGHVTVREAGSHLTLPSGITVLALELQAGSARAVLVLEVNQSSVPTPTIPVVTFSSSSYAVRVKITDTGLVGQVQASADNGEALRYSLHLGNAHLQERLIINDVGELHLSAPVNSGLYTFQVVANTIITLETGTATVHLSAEAVTVCGDEIVMPPLIVLDRDEEEAHYDLIQTYEGCHFSLSNRWPLDQTWLYVNETGLHTTAIDREHESIAFMALSQVQVEIILHCETDETRVKRSLQSESLISLDYGSSKWVLTDTIHYNSRRSLVNLIVNDINDNAPVFVGKEQEPIAVGYPVRELEERVLPRSLAELQATDADIGENAALLYWSSEPALAVAPATGFVHIRNGATLEHDARLTVHATDRNGHLDGLTGSIDIIVKLLDESNIAVVTVRDLFLDNESNVLSHLSQSVGYEIRVLRSVVISGEEASEASSRKKREVSSATGALLQLYIYGLIDREPVSIEQLTTDITNAVISQVNIASAVSLEDHLAGQEICVILGRDTGLLVATIVLSVLLFIIIVLIAVWFFLRWRRKQNYDQFSDANSLASRNESVDQSPKPVDVTTKPRLNLEELKKSERRLQEMLDAPIQEVTVDPTLSRKDAILDIPLAPDSNASIVIQSIDKLKDAADDLSDDEFGEIKPTKRKSVVTFNENVEKIIHIEDIDAPVESKSPGYEIYKL